jgi:uncharacterized phage-associated protein
MKIEKDDFEAWRDNPITQAVFKAFDMLGEKAKQQWLTASWQNGNTDPLMLADLRARAEVVEDFRNVSLDDLEEWLDESDGKSAA